MSDISIAQAANMLPIEDIAKRLGISRDNLELYGNYKAKISHTNIQNNKLGKLVLVTALTPTPSGEGKTTVTIGLVDGFNKIGVKTAGALREPSLGPVFGMKGGAAGGGYSQVVPMEDINLHFTGDFAAIEKANNLLSAMIDNELHFPSDSCDNLDPRKIFWKRVFDMNDRVLRNITVGLGGPLNGMAREDGFNITAASEVMAILCLATDIADLKKRLGDIFIGYTMKKKPVFARDLNVQGAMAALLKDAIKPNLVQTLENNPVFIHGGPFANIAHGANSILATKTAMSMADYTITEAGFASDLGAEKFFNIKSRYAGISPNAVVVVATTRALKYHGSGKIIDGIDNETLKNGMPNLIKHITNMKKFDVPVIVAINKFGFDTEEEIGIIKEAVKGIADACEISDGWANGSEGTSNLATTVKSLADKNDNPLKTLYDLDMSIEEKIKIIATEIYGADNIEFAPKAKKDLAMIRDLGLEKLPICMAKTQKSFSDDPKLYGVPKDFTISIREFEIASGAGFIVPIAGNMLRMPGLPRKPSALNIDVDDNGKISGLF